MRRLNRDLVRGWEFCHGQAKSTATNEGVRVHPALLPRIATVSGSEGVDVALSIWGPETNSQGGRLRSTVFQGCLDHVPGAFGISLGVVTSLKEEHENSASRIFSNDRDCLAPHVHSRRAKGSVRPCRSEMTLDVESVVGGCVS